MKFGDLKKNLSIKKKEGKAVPEDVLIESTSAEQIAEMKKRLANRTRDLEEAQNRLKDLKQSPGEDEEAVDADGKPAGPHPPLQELSLDDIQLDDSDEDPQFDSVVDGGNPVQMVDMTKPEPVVKPAEEGLNLESVPAAGSAGGSAADDDDEDDDEAASGDLDDLSLDAADDSDDLSNLFSQEEEEEHPLANLINFLPDVSVQELVDDIEEIKSIIKEWQQSR